MLRIHRSHHEDHFTIIPNSTLRDDRLSFRARGVLAELLSRPKDWQTTADALSRHAKVARGRKGEGRDAMRAVFAELENTGYLKRTKTQDETGQWVTVFDLYDVSQELGNQASADQSSEGQASIRSTEDEATNTNTEERRLALAPRAQHEKQHQPSWRKNDLQLFAEIIGADTIKSDGSKWREGLFTTEAFYKAYMRAKKQWPGAWIEAIDDRDGLEYWLMQEGLTVVE